MNFQGSEGDLSEDCYLAGFDVVELLKTINFNISCIPLKRLMVREDRSIGLFYWTVLLDCSPSGTNSFPNPTSMREKIVPPLMVTCNFSFLKMSAPSFASSVAGVYLKSTSLVVSRSSEPKATKPVHEVGTVLRKTETGGRLDDENYGADMHSSEICSFEGIKVGSAALEFLLEFVSVD